MPYHATPREPRQQRTCLNCGKDMSVTMAELRQGKGKYCGRSCYQRARPARSVVESICAHCGATFVQPRKNAGHRCCSRECARRAEVLPLAERMAAKTDSSGDCALWTGTRDENGYGQIIVERHRRYAHRVAWELVAGPLPPGMEVCHTCDTPACVRNDDEGWYEVNGVLCPRRGHLFLGTHAENFADMAAKGRHFSRTRPELVPRGERSGLTHLTAEQVRDIRARQAQGENMAALGREFAVTRQGIRAIVRRKVWTHVP